MNKFTQEEYENAKNVNLVDYLMLNGYNLKKKGREFCLAEHDSLTINPDKNTWFWWSRNIGGGVIQFLQEYENKTLVEAIYSLNNKSTSELRAYTKYEPVYQNTENKELILPEKHEDNKRAWSYLVKSRCIDREIVNYLLDEDYIYQNNKGGVVFLGKDNENNVKFACVRSTSSNNSFRQDVTNSTKKYSFKIRGKNDKLFVFESPIDLLSHATISKMQGKNWKEDNRVSLGGVSDIALDKFLDDNENIKEIVLFLDNDVAGRKSENKICKKYSENYKVSIFHTKYKDLNETLVNYKKELEKDKNVNIKNFIEKVKKPFIEPKLQNKEILKEYFKKITKDIDDSVIDKFFNQNSVGFSENNKLVLFSKVENEENIGAYELDVYNMQYEKADIVENSYEIPVLFNNVNNEKDDLLIVINNILGAIYFNDISNVAYINDYKNILNLENILAKNDFKEVCLSIDKEDNLLKDEEFLNKVNTLKEKYPNININVNTTFVREDFYSMIKDEYIRKPFLKADVGNNEELYQYMLRNTPLEKEKIIRLFKENHIYQDVDRNMVFLVKDKEGNDIGGYSLNIYSDNRTIKILDNSCFSEVKIEPTRIRNFVEYIKNSLSIEKNQEQGLDMEL